MVGWLVGLLHNVTHGHQVIGDYRGGFLAFGWFVESRVADWDLLRLPIVEIGEVHRLWCLVMVMHLNVV